MQQSAKESAIINKIYGSICSLSNKVDRIKDKKAEYIVLALYLIGHIVITYFHEPWYDEAEAWNIAKSGTLKEIIFDVPHLEGHPALWYIILKVFTVLGINYEAALNICSLIFAGIAVYLLIFKSPFPRIVRILLPFTYFFFYQYGVITRPYCVTMMAFVVAAVVYKLRSTKPWLYTLSLALICATSAYGLVLSGGLAVAWVIELLKKNKIKALLKDKSTYCLLGLLIYALFILYRIIPKDSSSISFASENFVNGLGVRLVYTFFVIVPDLFLTNIFNEYGHLHDMPFEFVSFSITAIVGVVILFGFIRYAIVKKTIIQLSIPFILFSLFSGFVYLYNHHIGILLCFFIFWLWISFEIPSSYKVNNFKRYTTTIAIAGCLMVSLGWSMISSVVEVIDNYGPAAEIAEYLEESKLEDATILFSWNGDKYGVKYSPLEVAFLPYKTKEKIMNWPVENPLFPFYLASETIDLYEDILLRISNGPIPSVVVGEVDFSTLYEDRVNSTDYYCAKQVQHAIIWKGTQKNCTTKIYKYKDIKG